MKKDPFVLAYDLGTGGVKAAIVDPEGRVLRTSSADYPLYTPGPDMAEQDAEDYWQGLVRSTRAVFQDGAFDPSCCIGLAIGAMWRGITPVDSNGAPLSRGMIWLDTRARAEAEELMRIFPGRYFAPNEYWPKMLWLRRHCPDIVREADQFLEANAFLKRRMTGRATSDPSNCYTDSFDPLLASFYREVREYCGVPERKFPALIHSDDQAGILLPEAADVLGLPAGIPVFGGSGDIPAIAIGSGSSGIGSAHLYLGSSGWVGYSVAHRPNEQHGSGFDEARDIDLFGLHSVGLSYRLAVRQLYAAEYAAQGEAIFSEVDRQAGEIPPGSEGVCAVPWFFGEDAPIGGKDAKGCYLNLGPNTDRRHMMRALLESICYEFSLAMEWKEQKNGYPRPEFICAVGGGAQSAVWMQMLSDVLNMPVRVIGSPRHAGARGIAYHALKGLGIAGSYEDAGKNTMSGAEYLPDPAYAEVYRQGTERFRSLYETLRPVFTAE